ncbi:MAG: Ig-like domain repeat protein, partial [Anaerolineales bacterium]
DQLTFEYSTSASSLTSGTWTRVPALDFVTPDTAVTGPKNGNAPAERRTLSGTISGLNIPSGGTFWIRWLDYDASSYDDGLAVDDFSLTPQIALSIDDVARREGDSGPADFAFTLTLSAPAPAGGVTFDIATADNSATTADGDYMPSSLAGQTIPAGSSTYTFNVPVNGDLQVESDESFFVNVTNVSGATISDGQGLGAIVNDDTATTVGTSASPSGYGTMVIFTATVTEPGVGTPAGSVEFFADGMSLGISALDAAGQAMLSTTSLAPGSHNITATYGGDANFGASTSPALTQVVEAPPGVLRITDVSGGEIVENEHTNAAITQLLVVFSKDMNAADTQNTLNYNLMRDGSTVIPIDGITYAAQTATLNINGGAALPDGRYRLAVNGVLRDALGAPIGMDFVRTFIVDRRAPRHTGIIALPDGRAITNGVTVTARFSSIQVTFDEDLNNPAGNTDSDDVTNSSNYILVTPGLNDVFDKVSCAPGLGSDDVHIFTGPVTYDNHGDSGPFVATLQINGGVPLSNGRYQLFLCGSTSIVDLAGNGLNDNRDESVIFNVLALDSLKRPPQTGFAPGVVTLLPEQPADKAYTDLEELWLEIPRLNLKTGITGVPLKPDGWDVTWLNWQVGWLEGTAYPTWQGNTVLTAHGYTADGEAGPFARLKELSYGETIVIHLSGMKYTYAVRTNLLTSSNNTYWLTKHEQLDWITLVTCQQYDANTRSYRYRRVVRAVLVSVEKE